MPKRSSSKRPPREDPNEAAFRIVQEATAEDEPAPKPPKGKNPAAVALGRLGGKKGGQARAAALSAERRAEIAREAARKRWGEQKPKR